VFSGGSLPFPASRKCRSGRFKRSSVAGSAATSRFYTGWVVSGLSRTLLALPAVADSIVASDRCGTVRRAFVAYMICENSIPESVRLVAELVATFLFVQKYAASGFSSAHESALTSRPHVLPLISPNRIERVLVSVDHGRVHALVPEQVRYFAH